MKPKNQLGVIALCLLTYCLHAQGGRVTIIINTRDVDPVTFNVNVGDISNVYRSGAGNSGERVLITPAEDFGTIQLYISEAEAHASMEILFDYTGSGEIHNVRTVAGTNIYPLNPALFAVANNEITFYKHKPKALPSLELRTNLIDGLLFDRSTMDFFTISGAEHFPRHELRVYQISAGSSNLQHRVFNEYSIEGQPHRLVYSSSTEFRWNGREADQANPGSFNHVNAGTYLFELDLWDDTNQKKTFHGQMIVQGIHP